jgi:enoyl-CoA hydratase
VAPEGGTSLQAVSNGFASDVLAIERDGAVATLWLDRPDARNALGPAFWEDLPVAMAAVSEDPTIRAVVVAARGPHFSVGLDLKAMGGMLTGGAAGGEGAAAAPSAARRSVATRQSIVRMQAAVTSVAASPKPVIAAIHGHCIGGGVDLVCACDIRLASADAVFSVRETKVAIVADLGSLQRLPRIVGSGQAAELALTGKDIGADRAKAIGLVNDVLTDHAEVLAAASAMAQEIAALSPLAVQGTKAVLAANDGRTVAQGLEYVAAWNAGMLVSDDLIEAMAAFADKRKPRFSGG